MGPGHVQPPRHMAGQCHTPLGGELAHQLELLQRGPVPAYREQITPLRLKVVEGDRTLEQCVGYLGADECVDLLVLATGHQPLHQDAQRHRDPDPHASAGTTSRAVRANRTASSSSPPYSAISARSAASRPCHIGMPRRAASSTSRSQEVRASSSRPWWMSATSALTHSITVRSSRVPRRRARSAAISPADRGIRAEHQREQQRRLHLGVGPGRTGGHLLPPSSRTAAG